MDRSLKATLFQFFMVVLVTALFISFSEQTDILPTGNVILANDDIGSFAPPFDAFSGSPIITLTHAQVDNETFHISAQVDQSNARIYHNLYYYTKAGWEPISISGQQYLKNSVSAEIDGRYDEYDLVEGDDFFLGVWSCKATGSSWECGCKTVDDCGYWHIQSIDLAYEGVTVTPCVDNDADGFGNIGNELCTFAAQDCDDTNSSISPSATEITYNGVDDDCNTTTFDDDLDRDGYVLNNDCNDLSSAIHPSAIDICEDQIDQDCSGTDKLCAQCGEGSIPYTGCSCQGSGVYDGYCCENVYQLTPCGTPEVIFMDGFESGTANTWDYLNPTSRVNQDVVYKGAYSLNLIYSPGTSSLKLNQEANTALPASSHLYHRWRVNFEPDFIQPVNLLRLATISGGSWDVIVGMRRWQGSTDRGKIHILSDGQEYASTAVLQNDQWYCVETEIDTGALGTIRIWVDGVLVLTVPNLSLVGDIDHLEQGGLYEGNIAETPLHEYIDDVVVSTIPIGCN